MCTNETLVHFNIQMKQIPVSISRGLNLLVNSALLAAAVLLSLIAIEIGLRLSAGPDQAGHHALCCQYDALLGWRHVPDRTIQYVTDEYTISQSYNSRGVRGPEYALDKPTDEYRVVVLGDSFAEGMSVDFDDLFSEVMKRGLNRGRSEPIEVINLGVSGYSTDQQLLAYQTEGKLYQPDLTILLVYDNDIWFNAKNLYTSMGRGNKPLFELIEDQLEMANYPVPKEAPAKKKRKVPNEPASYLTGIKGQLREHSELYLWTRTRIKNTAAVSTYLISIGLMSPIDAPEVPPMYSVYARIPSAEVTHAWRLTRKLIDKIREEADAARSAFLLVHAPPKIAVHDEYWQVFKKNYDVDDSGWSPRQVNEQLADIADDLAIDFYNPLPELKSEADAQRFYFEIDTHWNRNGNRKVGELLAEHIDASYLPEPTALPEPTTFLRADPGSPEISSPSD